MPTLTLVDHMPDPDEDGDFSEELLYCSLPEDTFDAFVEWMRGQEVRKSGVRTIYLRADVERYFRRDLGVV